MLNVRTIIRRKTFKSWEEPGMRGEDWERANRPLESGAGNPNWRDRSFAINFPFEIGSVLGGNQQKI